MGGVSPHPAPEVGWSRVAGQQDGRLWSLVSTAGSGRMGIRVLEVDSPVSGCVCRILGVCFWHLFSYS